MIISIAFLVAAAVGALLRTWIGQRLNKPQGMAWGTMLINISGSFALGALAGVGPPAATVLGTGLLGAYTTMSSFARDVVAAIERRQPWDATTYVALSVLGAIGAAWLGLSLVS